MNRKAVNFSVSVWARTRSRASFPNLSALHRQLTIAFFAAVNHLNGPLYRKQNFTLKGSKGHGLWLVIGGFRSVLCVSVFQGSLLVVVIMIDGSEKRNCEGGLWTLEFACLWKAHYKTGQFGWAIVWIRTRIQFLSGLFAGVAVVRSKGSFCLSQEGGYYILWHVITYYEHVVSQTMCKRDTHQRRSLGCHTL